METYGHSSQGSSRGINSCLVFFLRTVLSNPESSSVLIKYKEYNLLTWKQTKNMEVKLKLDILDLKLYVGLTVGLLDLFIIYFCLRVKGERDWLF